MRNQQDLGGSRRIKEDLAGSSRICEGRVQKKKEGREEGKLS
jgi:hypothetical protein